MEKLMQIAKALDIRVRLDVMSDCAAEAYVNTKGIRFVTIDARGSKEEMEFSLAHELAHYFLHLYNGYNMDIATEEETARVEAQADWFAEGMLRMLGRAA